MGHALAFRAGPRGPAFAETVPLPAIIVGPSRRDKMAESTPRPEELPRHARQHVESLKAAGVEWLPTAPPPRRRKAAATSSSTTAADSRSLFDEQAPAPAGSSQTADQRRHELEVLAEQVKPCM